MATTEDIPANRSRLLSVNIDVTKKVIVWFFLTLMQISLGNNTGISEQTVMNLTSYKDVTKHRLPESGNKNTPENSLFSLDLDNKNSYGLNVADSLFGNTTDRIPADVIRPSCQIYLDFFSTSVSEFMRCSIKHARPLRFCGECVKEYAAVVNDYNAIIMDETRDSAGTKCRDRILNADRVQIIVQIKNFITKLWSQSFCSACFEVKTVNNTEEYYKTEEVLTFEDLYNSTLQCIVNVSGGIIDPMQPYNVFNCSNRAEVCKKCAKFYQELNKMYIHMEDETKDRVCMDIVDSMNYTRLLWSRDLSCSHKEREIIPVLLLTFFFCILPVIFYIGTKVHGVKQERLILQQKRMHNMTASNSVGSSAEDEEQH